MGTCTESVEGKPELTNEMKPAIVRGFAERYSRLKRFHLCRNNPTFNTCNDHNLICHLHSAAQLVISKDERELSDEILPQNAQKIGNTNSNNTMATGQTNLGSSH